MRRWDPWKASSNRQQPFIDGGVLENIPPARIMREGPVSVQSGPVADFRRLRHDLESHLFAANSLFNSLTSEQTTAQQFVVNELGDEVVSKCTVVLEFRRQLLEAVIRLHRDQSSECVDDRVTIRIKLIEQPLVCARLSLPTPYLAGNTWEDHDDWKRAIDENVPIEFIDDLGS